MDLEEIQKTLEEIQKGIDTLILQCKNDTFTHIRTHIHTLPYIPYKGHIECRVVSIEMIKLSVLYELKLTTD